MSFNMNSASAQL